jgi:class 3 adenylate cyclase
MHCGVAMPLRCPACGTRTPAEARFCFKCGVALSEPADGDAGRGFALGARDDPKPPVAGPAPANTEADRAAEPLGERKHITALFADIAGSTKLLAGLDPEDARELLNAVMTGLSAEVNRLGGTVAKIMGDGLFAIFGAPLAQENHAYRACLAASEMHRVTAEGEARFAKVVRLRIGLHSGNAIIDQTGEGPDARFDAIGEAVNIAANLEASAPVGHTLLSDVTRQLAGPTVETERFTQDGLVTEIPGSSAWILTTCQRSRNTLVLSATESQIPFIGRERETAFVRAAMAELAAGRGQIVTILGETGVGKTRFLAETLSRFPAERITVISLAGQEIEQTNPDAILKEIVWSILESNGADGPPRSGEEVGARLAESEPALAEAGRACAWFLFADEADHSGAEAQKMRIEALSHIKGLIYHVARKQPLDSQIKCNT